MRRRGKEDIDPEYMADFVQNERFTVKGHRNNAIVTMLRQWPELAKLFNALFLPGDTGGKRLASLEIVPVRGWRRWSLSRFGNILLLCWPLCHTHIVAIETASM